jgi:poly(3-hydroxyalkanoate) synthetase
VKLLTVLVDFENVFGMDKLRNNLNITFFKKDLIELGYIVFRSFAISFQWSKCFGYRGQQIRLSRTSDQWS